MFRRLSGLIVALAALLVVPQVVNAQGAPRLRTDIDLPGSDILNFDLPPGSAEMCMRYCAGHGQCRAFTYAPNSVPSVLGTSLGTTDRCWIKNSVPAEVVRPGLTSGVKGIDFHASDAAVPPEIAPPFPFPDGAARSGWGSLRAEGAVPLVFFTIDTAPAPGQPARPGCAAEPMYDSIFSNEYAFFQRASAHSYIGGVASYLNYTSRGRFLLGRTAVYPAFHACPGNGGVLQDFVAAAAAVSFRFAPFDKNGDHRITSDELIVVGKTNGGDRDVQTGTGCVVTREMGPDGLTPIALCTGARYRHEVLETDQVRSVLSQRGIDIDSYTGPWSDPCWSRGLTMMSCPSIPHYESRNFDPWHRMAFGWANPRFAPTNRSARLLLTAYSDDPTVAPTQADNPVIIYNPVRGLDEFFIVEYRSVLRVYDIDVCICFPGDYNRITGPLIWYVRLDGRGHVATLLSGVEGGGPGGTIVSAISPLDDAWPATGTPRRIYPGVNGRIDTAISPTDRRIVSRALYASNSALTQGPLTPEAPTLLRPTDRVSLTWADGTDAGVTLSRNPDPGYDQATLVITVNDPTNLRPVKRDLRRRPLIPVDPRVGSKKP